MELIISSISHRAPQVSELLTNEESEDAQLRAHFSESRWTRPTSESLNSQLRGKIGNFGHTLEVAGKSDLVVREKFSEWEGTLQLLEGNIVNYFRSSRMSSDQLAECVSRMHSRLPFRLFHGGTPAMMKSYRHLHKQRLSGNCGISWKI